MTAAPSEHAKGSFTRPRSSERLVAVRCGDQSGPTTVIICAIHGNEPMGLRAAKRVITALSDDARTFRGRVFAVLGNRRALSVGARMIDEDLNRVFRYRMHESGAPMLDAAIDPHHVEVRERNEIIALLADIADERSRTHEMHVIDLHTFSADGAPFVVFSDTMRNRAFAACWPIPRILGIAEAVPGTLTDYVTAAGCISAVVETGRHDDDRARVRHEAVIRLALAHAGHLDPDEWPELEHDRALLAEASRGAPHTLDVAVRHGIRPSDRFAMRPGYDNFQLVSKDEVLADDVNGPVRATRAGRIMLPLYQAQGDDGFFIGRVIGDFWLGLSSLLRRLKPSRLAPMLPGVHRHPEEPGAFIVDRRVARWLVADVFHLLGFRMLRHDERTITVTRRPHDRRRPDEISFPLRASD